MPSYIINAEALEAGERFQFVALTSSWKNQRRKRRQLAREQQQIDSADQTAQADCNGQPDADSSCSAEKKRRVDETQEVGHTSGVLRNAEVPPVLHIEFNILSKTVSDLKAIVEIEVRFLNGTSGPNGAYELSQYIQNKWIRT